MTKGLCSEVHPNGSRCAEPSGHYPATNHRPRNEHHCHARGCMVPTKPEMLMCLAHWRMVPRVLQKAVWATYRRGQCDDKQPSAEWHNAADAAIAAVADKEAALLRRHPKPPLAPACAEGEGEGGA